MEARSPQPSSSLFWLLPACLVAVVAGQLLWLRNTPRVVRAELAQWQLFIPANQSPRAGQRWLAKPYFDKQWSVQLELLKLEDEHQGLWSARPTHWLPQGQQLPDRWRLQRRGEAKLSSALRGVRWRLLRRKKPGQLVLAKAAPAWPKRGRWLVYHGHAQRKSKAVGMIEATAQGPRWVAKDWRVIEKQPGPWSLRPHQGSLPRALREHRWPPTLAIEIRAQGGQPQWRLRRPAPAMDMSAYIWVALPPKSAQDADEPLGVLRIKAASKGWAPFHRVIWRRAKAHEVLRIKPKSGPAPDLSRQGTILKTPCKAPDSALGGKCVLTSLGAQQGAVVPRWYQILGQKHSYKRTRDAAGFVHLTRLTGRETSQGYAYLWPPKRRRFKELALLSNEERVQQALLQCYVLGYVTKMFNRIKRFPKKYKRWRREHEAIKKRISAVLLLGTVAHDRKGPSSKAVELQRCISRMMQRLAASYERLNKEDPPKPRATSAPSP